MIWVDTITRFLHIWFGILWIGLLYYFNYVQMSYFAEATPDAKADATQKLVPRALWFFRWAAAFTFITGLILLAHMGAAWTASVLFGGVLGTFMFLNVWLIIWPNQKLVIAKDKNAAEAGRKAALASRTNTLFSFPMLFFMVFSAHLKGISGLGSFLFFSQYDIMSWVLLAAALVIIFAFEFNAIKGKLPKFMTSVKGVIHSGVALTVVLGLLVGMM